MGARDGCAMKIEQFRLLKKFMMMTMSGSEAEVNMAIKKANEAVVEAGTDWNKILDRVVKVELEIESADVAEGRSTEPGAAAASKVARAKLVNDAFKTIEESDPRGDAADFIASLKDQWDRRGFLTDLQMKALLKFEKNARDKLENRR